MVVDKKFFYIVPVINGGTQYQNQHTQYVDSTRNIVIAELAPVFSVGITEVRRVTGD